MSLQGVLAALFAAGTIITTLNTYGLPLLDPSKLDLNPSTVTAALPGTLAFFALLGKLSHSLPCIATLRIYSYRTPSNVFNERVPSNQQVNA